MKQACLRFFLVSLLLLLLAPLAAAAQPANVRVGYVLPKNNILPPLKAQQTYLAYFDEIARHTGRYYDAVAISASDGFAALKAGQIDFLVPAEPNAARKEEGILYSELDCCYDLLGLYARTDSTLDARNIASLDGASVGLQQNRTANAYLDDFLLDNQLRMQKHYYASQADMSAALAAGEIDLYVDTDTNSTGTDKMLLPFAIIPARMAALAIHQDLMNDLNEATTAINIENPRFLTERYTSLFLPALRQVTYFNRKETDFIQHAPKLTCVLYGEQMPFIHYDKASSSFSGVYPDILRLLATEAGLSLHFVYAESVDQARTMLKDGTADLMLDIYHCNDYAGEFYFTNPLYNEQYAFVCQKDLSNPDAIRNLYLSSDSAAVQHYIHTQLPQLLHDIPEINECLDAANQDRNTAALVSTLQLQFSRAIILYPNLAILPTSEVDVPISLAISRHQPQILQTVLNKAILRLDPQKTNTILIHYTMDAKPPLTPNYLMRYYPLQFSVALGLLLLLLVAGGILCYHNHTSYRQRLLLAEKNKALEETILALQDASLARDSYKYMAESDPLTGVMNKAGIEAACREILLSQDLADSRHAFLIIDLDHFKEANDTYGHQYGDDILKKFAAALPHIIRQQDAVGRFGGDEFIIFLKHINSLTAIHRIAKQINSAAHELDIKKDKPALSASIGIALVPQHGQRYEDIFQAADRALYHTKAHGRDGYTIYSEQLED